MTRLPTIVLLACLGFAPLVHAATPTPAPSGQQQAQSAPRDVVVKAVRQMTQRINAEHNKLTSDPGYASKLVSEELDELVDFKRITRLVMGPWFNKATRAQKYRFLAVFKQSMIDTYASGVTLYQGQKIEVLPMRPQDTKGDRAFVRMQLTTDSGRAIPVSYTMILNQGRWQVENVIVNGLNLGKTFRAQFAQAAASCHNDIDCVIDHWAQQLKSSEGVSDLSDKAKQ